MDFQTNSVSLWFSHLEELEAELAPPPASASMAILRELGLQGTPATARLEALLANGMSGGSDDHSTAHRATVVPAGTARTGRSS